MRILIVEDEPLIAISLAAELRHAGHEVLGPSADSDEALCLAGDGHADIALIDIDADGFMNGIELARTLQAQCDIPSLFLTTQRALALANSDAALGVITIPFNPADIPDSIHVAELVMHGGESTLRNVPHSLELFTTESTTAPRSSAH